jgi:hypothetical protein
MNLRVRLERLEAAEPAKDDPRHDEARLLALVKRLEVANRNRPPQKRNPDARESDAQELRDALRQARARAREDD